MSVRIIDNKKVDMTNDEWSIYGKICRSYDRENFKGEELFKDLFETDDDGIIMFIKPPSHRHTSIEVFLFVASIFEHQHLRLMHSRVDDICNQMKEKMREVDEALKQIKGKSSE